ncbi:MAG TPA: lysylphosphatidylglycerol synthase transmembrane domain-containing protein [Gemmatimonadaceae bacterium]|nr:lysylphosphatidylglycerol synthase transmembrane domain-containing protein [Gemmatimonadaceae bacterium]
MSSFSVRHAFAAATVVLIASIALTRVDWPTISHAVLRASAPLLLATMVVTFASTALKSVRWWIFLRSRTQLRFSFVLRLTTASTGMNALLVANAGDIMRVEVAAKRAKVGRRVILRSLVCDKVVEVLAFATFAALTIALADTPWLPRPAIVIGAASVVLFFLAWLASNKAKELRGKAGATAYALSLLSWLTQIVTYSLAARAVGLTLPLSATMATLVAVNLGGVLRLTPGNIGVYQAMYALALTPFGVPSSAAIGAAVLTQSAQIMSGAIAGAIATIRLSSFERSA